MIAAPAASRSPFVLMSRTLSFWAAGITILLGVGFLRGLLPPAFGSLAWGTGSCALLLLLIRIFLRHDQRAWAEVGLDVDLTSLPRFGAGLGLGIGTYALTLLLVSLVVGPIRLVHATAPAALPLVLALAGLFALAAMEELAFRSYALWVTIEALGTWPAQLLVAVAFGLLHLAYGWPPVTVLLGVLPSALLFGLAAVISRGLALPLGIHVGMNLGRWLTGEADGRGPWQLELTRLPPAQAGMWAPVLGALAPLLMGGLLWAWHRRRPATPARPPAAA